MLDPITAKAGGVIAGKLVGAATTRLTTAAIGTKQRRAIEKAYSEAFKRWLVSLDAPVRDHAALIVGDFVSDPIVADSMIDSVLTGRALAVEDLAARFEELGYDAGTLPFDLEAALRSLSGHLSEVTLAMAGEDTGGLFARAAVSGITAIRELVTADGKRVVDLTEGLFALPSAPEQGIRRFLDDYLGHDDHDTPFGGRNDELQRLTAWARSGDAESYALVIAPAGGGKSALLVRLADAMRRDERTDVVLVPVSVRYGTGLSQDVFATLVTRLAHLHGRSNLQGLESGGSPWRRVAAALLAEPPVVGRRLVVIIDGLDEAVDWEPGADMFPLVAPAGLRVIVSARERPDDPDGRSWLDQLGWATPDAHVLRLGPLTRDGIRDVLVTAALGREDRHDALADALHRLTFGDPVLVALYVDDIARASAAGRNMDVAELASRPAGLGAYFDRFFEDQQRLWRGRGAAPLLERTARSLLNLLSGARGPLLLREIVDEVARPGDQLDSLALRAVMPDLERFVVGDGESSGYVLSHPRLGEYLRSRLTARERAEIEGRYLAWGDAVLSRLDERRPAPVPSYLLAYLATHLYESLDDPNGRADACARLTCRGWLDARVDAMGSYEGFSADVEAAGKASTAAGRAQVAHEGRVREMGRLVRYTLIKSSTRSVADNMPASLLAHLVDAGLWSAEQALASVRAMLTEAGQAAAITAMAPFLPTPLAHEAVHLVRRFTWAGSSVPASLALSARLGGETGCRLVDETVTLSLRETMPEARIGYLTAVLPHLDEHRRQRVVDAIFVSIEAIRHWQPRGVALLAAYPVLDRRREPALRQWLADSRDDNRTEHYDGVRTGWLQVAAGMGACADDLDDELRMPCAAMLRRVVDSLRAQTRDPLAGLLRAELLTAIATLERQDEPARAAREAVTHITIDAWRARAVARMRIAGLSSREEPLEDAVVEVLIDDLYSNNGKSPLRRLVELGAIDLSSAAELAINRRSPAVRARATSALAGLVEDAGTRRRLLEEGLAAAMTLGDGYEADQALGSVVASAAAAGDADPARAALDYIEDPSQRVEPAMAISRARDDPELELEALAIAKEIPHGSLERSEILMSVARAASKQGAAAARAALLETIRHHDEDELGFAWHPVLSELAESAPLDFVLELHDALSMFDDDFESRAIVEAVIAGRPDAPGRAASPEAALEHARASPFPRIVLATLARIAPRLPDALRSAAVDEALTLIAEDDPDQGRSNELGLLGMAVGAARDPLLELALSMDEQEQVESLSLLIPGLPASRVVELVARTASFENIFDRALILDHVLPELPEEDGERLLSDAWDDLARVYGPMRVVPARAAYALRRLALSAAIIQAFHEPSLTKALDPDEAVARFVRAALSAPPTVAFEGIVLLLDALALREREHVFRVLRYLAPVLIELGEPGTVLEIATAIQDVRSWWP